jgi:hypothetical protein
MMKFFLSLFICFCQLLYAPHPCESLQEQSQQVSKAKTSSCHEDSNQKSSHPEKHEDFCFHCGTHCHPVALIIPKSDFFFHYEMTNISFVIPSKRTIYRIYLKDRPPTKLS